MSNCSNEIQVGQFDNVTVFRVIGRGDFQNAHAIKKCCQRMLDEKDVDMIFDLAQCTGMDSTFMGMLMGLNCMFQDEDSDSSLRIINVCGRNMNQLKMIGLVHVLPIEREPVDRSVETVPIDVSGQNRFDIKKTMLDAHQNLAKITKENEVAFRDIIDCLESQLKG